MGTENTVLVIVQNVYILVNACTYVTFCHLLFFMFGLLVLLGRMAVRAKSETLFKYCIK